MHLSYPTPAQVLVTESVFLSSSPPLPSGITMQFKVWPMEREQKWYVPISFLTYKIFLCVTFWALTLTQNTFPTTPHLTESYLAEAVWKRGCKKKKKTWLQILWHAIHRKVGIYVIFPWVWRASDCLCLTIETAEVKPRDFWGQVVKRRAASTFPRTPALGNINKIQLSTV